MNNSILEEEINQLDYKKEVLTKFILGSDFKKIEGREKILLLQQWSVMVRYYTILSELLLIRQIA